MKWWQKALISTGILLLVVAGLGFGLHTKFQKTSASSQETDAQDDKIGTFCGQLFGGGSVLIWVLAYKTRPRPARK